MRGREEQRRPADSGPGRAAHGRPGADLLRPLYYLPGLLLLLLAGLPFVFVLSEPNRFLAGRPAADEVLHGASVEAEVQRLRGRVERLEARLTAVAANPVLDLGGHIRLIPAGDGPATLQFEGVELEVVNDPRGAQKTEQERRP